MKDVAREAGVSIATVSNVINHTRPVSDPLRERVLESMEKLNYSVNPMAKNLRSGASHLLGVVLQSVNDVFFSELLMGLEARVRESRYRLLFINTNYSLEQEKKAIQDLHGLWIDGILLDSCAPESDLPAYRKYLQETGNGGKRVPIVSLERDLGFGCNAVEAENYQGAAAAAEHLLANGRRRILFLTGDRDWKMLSERARGYREALEPHGLPAVVLAEEGGMSMPAGYQAIRRAIEQGREFDAVFAANDRMAVGAILALKQYGRTVPQEVSVVGFDNIDVYQLFEPAPSTVNVPKYLMGYRAAEMMIHLVEGRARTLPVVRLKTDLVVRRSSDKDARGSLVLTGL